MRPQLQLSLFLTAMSVSGCSGTAPPTANSAQMNAILNQAEAELRESENAMGPLPGAPIGQVEVIHPSGQRAMLDLLPPGPPETIRQLASYIRDAGFECDAVRTANQLQENGRPLDVFKIDCANGRSFQATILNERSFIRPWDGRLLGPAGSVG